MVKIPVSLQNQQVSDSNFNPSGAEWLNQILWTTGAWKTNCNLFVLKNVAIMQLHNRKIYVRIILDAKQECLRILVYLNIINHLHNKLMEIFCQKHSAYKNVFLIFVSLNIVIHWHNKLREISINSIPCINMSTHLCKLEYQY